MQVSSDTVNGTVSYEPDNLAHFQREIEDFNRAIEQNGQPAATGTDGLKVVQVTVAMLESAAAGKTVRLEPVNIDQYR